MSLVLVIGGTGAQRRSQSPSGPWPFYGAYADCEGPNAQRVFAIVRRQRVQSFIRTGAPSLESSVTF